jgi:UDP-perosamine 4-acetyltransferase
MGEIVVIGGGGHAKVLIAVLKKTPRHILGYTDPRDGGPILGVAYLGGDDVLPGLRAAHPGCEAVIGVGKIDSSSARMGLQTQIGRLGFSFPAVVSSAAVVNEGVDLGPGTVVFDGVVVNSGASAGSACILNTGSIVEHDCRLGDNVHVAPGAVLSGGVTIGDDCMIGAGATVVHGVHVVPGCLVGAGAVVIGHVEVPGTYVGNPAKRIG